MEGDYRMTRDEHRAPGRLVPLRPGHGRGTTVPGRPQRYHTGPLPPSPDYAPPDEAPDDDADFPFPPRTGQVPPGIERSSDWSTSQRAHEDLDARYPPVGERDHGYPPSVPAEPEFPIRQEPIRRHDQIDVAFEPQELSTQERHQLLMHTIQLYGDYWKLAGIRANERRNRLEAYLVPRNKQIELKEAMSKNQALIIFIDNRGNTDVREPKKRGLLHRFFTWVFGA
jgi:hypothetical protein